MPWRLIDWRKYAAEMFSTLQQIYERNILTNDLLGKNMWLTILFLILADESEYPVLNHRLLVARRQDRDRDEGFHFKIGMNLLWELDFSIV